MSARARVSAARASVSVSYTPIEVTTPSTVTRTRYLPRYMLIPLGREVRVGIVVSVLLARARPCRRGSGVDPLTTRSVNQWR